MSTEITNLTIEIRRLIDTLRSSNSSSSSGSSSNSLADQQAEMLRDAMKKQTKALKEHTKTIADQAKESKALSSETIKTTNVMMKFGEASENTQLQVRRLSASINNQRNVANNVMQRMGVMKDAFDTVTTSSNSIAAKTSVLQEQINKTSEELAGLALTGSQLENTGRIISNTIDRLERTDEVTDEFVKSLKDNTKDVSSTAAFLDNLSGSVNTLDGVTTQYAHLLKTDQSVITQTTQALMSLGDSGIDVSATLDKLNSRVFDETEMQQELMEIQKKAAASYEFGAKAIVESTDKLVGSLTGLNAVVGRASNKFHELTGKLQDNITMATALANGSRTLLRDFDETRASRTDLWGQMTSFMSGVSQEAYVNISKTNRMAINAMGLERWADANSTATNSMRLYTANSDDAARAAADLYGQLALSGTRLTQFSEGELSQLAKQTGTLTKLTGQSESEISGRIQAYLADASVRNELIALGDDERKQRVMGIRQMALEGLTRGKTIEQTLEMQKAMKRFNREMDPKERIKQSYKTAAMATALGLSAEDAQALGTLGAAGKTDDPRFIQASANFVKVLEQARSSDNLGLQQLAYQVEQQSSAVMGVARMAEDNLTQNQAVASQDIFGVWENGVKVQVGKFEEVADVWDRISATATQAVNTLSSGFNSTGGAAVTALGSGALTVGGMIAASKLGLPSLVGSVASTAGTAASAVAVPAAAFAAMAGGVWQGGQAIATGRSDIHDALVSTEVGRDISDAIGAGITNALAFFGNDEAQATLQRLENARAQVEQSATKQNQASPTTQAETANTTENILTQINQQLMTLNEMQRREFMKSDEYRQLVIEEARRQNTIAKQQNASSVFNKVVEK